jgi:eukaryotic-like serine/threonine-protein kinase
VLLYEALTGRRPWRGSVVEILTQKAVGPPTPPSALAPVPPDLDRLCLDLLDVDPAARPRAQEILQRLGERGVAPERERVQNPIFVGREPELRVLRDAFDATAEGRPGAVLITGESGVGKSALVTHFLADLRKDHPAAVILRGRCYESESVPYKALDGIIDSLSHFLRSLAPAAAAALVPAKANLLTQVFPVLGRIDAMARAPRTTTDVLDPQERRARMSATLRDLFVRLSERYPVVLSIDDLQWADVDSVRLYRDVMQPPDAPPLLLVATVRGGANILPVAAEGKPLPGEGRSVHLLGLPPTEARQLASILMAESGGDAGHDAETIVREAAGHPLFIGELVRFSRSVGGGATAPRLEDAVRARFERLTPGQRRLLEVIAVAGRPLSTEHARLTARLDPDEMSRSVTRLKACSLVTCAGGKPHGPELDVYHDRVRIAVLAHVDAARAQDHHRSLAVTLEPLGDAEALAMHWFGAGDRRRAAEYAKKAADQAMESLAFSRAVDLYRFVLEVSAPTGARATELKRRLGDALTNAGRSMEAADVYLDATGDAPEAVAIELRSRAAGQFLRSGRFEQGMEALEQVAAAARLAVPRTSGRAMASIALRRAALAVRGLRFTERKATEVDPRQLMVIDTCWSAAIALSMVDTVRGTDFAIRHLLLALRAGEPSRIARGLAAEAAYRAVEGADATAATARLLARAHEVGERTQEPYVIASCRLGAGAAAYHHGDWPLGLRLCAEAEQIFQERCTGVSWEAATARMFCLWSMFYLGDLSGINARLVQLLEAAEKRGDLYEATTLRAAHTNLAFLALDDPDRARAQIIEAMRSRWSAHKLNLHHYYELYSLTQIDLYLGAGIRAFERVTRDLPRLARSWMSRIEVVRVEMNVLRARAALAAAGETFMTPSARRVASAAARSIARERGAWTVGFASLLDAQLEEDGERADGMLRRAVEQFELASMGLHAAVSRRRLGELMGGDDGRALVSTADGWMRDHGVANPERMTALLAPMPLLRRITGH